MSDVSDMASFDGCRSKIGQWTTYRIQASHSSIAFKHRTQASHSSIAFKHRIQLSHSHISDTSDAALFRGDQRPTGGCAIRRPLQSPQMIIGPVKGGGCGRGGGSEYTGMPIRVISRTNQRNRGRTSADRSTKATLMLTVPRSLIKSSTKDLT